MVTQYLTTEQISLLWQAFSRKNVNDDTEKKAGIAKVFKGLMDPAQLWVQQRNGDLVAKPDPRGGRQFSNKTHAAVFTKEQASYLKECLAELKSAKEGDGSPTVDASMADDVHLLEHTILPGWTSTVRDEEPTESDAPAEPAEEPATA